MGVGYTDSLPVFFSYGTRSPIYCAAYQAERTGNMGSKRYLAQEI